MSEKYMSDDNLDTSLNLVVAMFSSSSQIL